MNGIERAVRRWVLGTAMGLAASACGADPALPGAAAGDPQAIVGGSASMRYPEVGEFTYRGQRCLATLISLRHFVTAAKCVGGTWIDEMDRAKATLRINGELDIPVDRIHSLGGRDGSHDIAVGMLERDVPAFMATPAWLAAVPPEEGRRVHSVGFGCLSNDDGTTTENEEVLEEIVDGTKYVRTHAWREFTDFLCSNDVGAPTFLGEPNVNGSRTILALASGSDQADFFAEVPLHKLRIEQIIREWKRDDKHVEEEKTGFEWDVERAGSSFDVVDVATLIACRDRCEAESGCLAFSFDGGTRRCHLKAAVPEPRFKPGFVSGLARSIEHPYARPGGEEIDTPNTTNCADACIANPECNSYSYVKSFNAGLCSLKRDVPSPVSRDQYTSGRRRNFEHGAERPGADLPDGTSEEPDPRACAARCERNGDCMAFTYYRSSRRCVQKEFAPPIHYTRNEDAVSGVRRGWELHTTLLTSGDLPPQVIEHPLPQFCQSICEQNPECGGWSLVTAGDTATRNVCYLARYVHQHKGSQYGVISGVRGGAFF